MNAPHVSTSENHQRNEIWSTLQRARRSAKSQGDLSTDPVRSGAEPVRVLTSRDTKHSSTAQPVSTQAPSAPAALPAPDLEALTVEGLQEVWGQADARYDLDGNGTVGFNDLTMLLRQLAHAEAKPASAPAPAPEIDPALAALTPDVEVEESSPLTLDGLLAAYGTADKRYDLDHNGTVGFKDLSLFLQQQGQQTQAPEPAVPDAAAALASDAAPESTALTVEGLKAAWGTGDKRYDFDDDGNVGFNDLTLLLRRLASGGAPAAEDDGTAPKLAATGAPDVRPERAIASRLRAFSRSLVDRLDRAGFAERPPLNLHNLVDGLKLRADHEKTLLERLSKHYPDGLGVNVKG